jgi:hypothetical protein
VIARLELRRLDAHRLALLIPFRVRFLPAVVSGWLFYALAGAGGGLVTGPRVVALALCLVSALAALYDDRWIFDDHEKKVTRRLGLLFAARETTLDMASLQRVVLGGRIVAGSREDDGQAGRRRAAIASFASLALEEVSGKKHRLEQYRGGRAAELRDVAAEIAAFCGLPLEDRTAPAA